MILPNGTYDLGIFDLDTKQLKAELSSIPFWEIRFATKQLMPPSARCSHKCFKWQLHHNFRYNLEGSIEVKLDFHQYTCHNSFYERGYSGEEVILTICLISTCLIHSVLLMKYFVKVADSFRNF